ncbi:MAG: hypothetical protein AB3N33_05120 [Puniceicoccaceae bacterium]
MVNTRSEELAALYVLDLLEPGERRDFESQLEDSPELRTLVYELSEGLHSGLRQADGPRRMDLLAGIHEKLGEGEPAARPAKEPAKVIPWSYIWAAAAGLLLMMNLILVFIVGGQSSVRAKDVLARVSGNDGPGLVESARMVATNKLDAKTLEARISRLRSQLTERESELQRLMVARSKLEAENKEVRQFNAGWQREYMHLAARVLPFFESKDGLSRFTVIEMVDVQSFDSQQPRKGFADLAGRFLTGEGNIAGVGSEEFVGPVVEGAGLSTGTAIDPGTALGTGSFANPIPQTSRSMDTVPSPEGDASSSPTRDSAMGFSVWRDDEQKGFLDIYNLPQPGQGRDAFLWVRASELDPYIPVGYLPELDNGTGSFFYAVDEPQYTPTEILITAEDAFEPGQKPSGEVLLLGP